MLYSCGLSLVYSLGRLASYKTSEFESAPTGICDHGDSPDCNLKLPTVRRQLERNPQCSTSDPGPSPAVAFARNLGGLRTTRGHPAAVPAAPTRSPLAARPGVTVREITRTHTEMPDGVKCEQCENGRIQPPAPAPAPASPPATASGTMPARAAGLCPTAAGGIHWHHASDHDARGGRGRAGPGPHGTGNLGGRPGSGPGLVAGPAGPCIAGDRDLPVRLARLKMRGLPGQRTLCTALRLPVLRIEARRAPEWSQLIEVPDRSESGRSVSRLPLGAGTGPTILR